MTCTRYASCVLMAGRRLRGVFFVLVLLRCRRSDTASPSRSKPYWESADASRQLASDCLHTADPDKRSGPQKKNCQDTTERRSQACAMRFLCVVFLLSS